MAATNVLTEIIDIGIALSAEKNLDRLLSLILNKSMDFSSSDAGSLYLVQKDGMRFKLALNRSVPVQFSETVLPLTRTSIAGWVALSGEPLLIEDAYAIPADTPYTFHRTIDSTYGYRSKSMMTLPMKNHKGATIGVLQLINCKRDPAVRLENPAIVEREVIPYPAEMVQLMTALASLAAVALENSQLYQAIQELFEGFVRASVKAIEQRDPTTSGHSMRVSILTTSLAEAVDRAESGRFAGMHFDEITLRELKYAGLLHDFGKVGVREEVLVKGKKLYPFELERIWWRIQYQKKNIQFQTMQKKYAAKRPEEVAQIEAWEAAELKRIEEVYQTILRADEPTVLPEGDFQFLQEIRRMPFETPGNTIEPLLSEDEAKVLSIRKGSLDDKERLEIESHVTHSYNFLTKIPWTQDLGGIPDIAYAHHEKLNGKGYPRHLQNPDIPIQAKMMAVADIFDALSASDRPYKKALPVQKALDILKMEAKDGMLDSDLVDLFIECKAWEKTLHLRLTAV